MPVSKESREQLGRALAEAREEAGLTVVQLAQIASPGRVGGLSRYYDAEAGRRMATSETVSHYVAALDRPDLQDLRNKILSRRPATSGPGDLVPADDEPPVVNGFDPVAARLEPPAAAVEPAPVDVATEQRPASLREALPNPELLSESLLGPLEELIGDRPSLDDGTVVRGREGILRAACALLEEAIEISTAGSRSVSVQVVQLNPDRTFTRNLGTAVPFASRLFPFQLQRLTAAGGGIRHLLCRDIMHSLDMWIAFERFIALMELAGDYSVYWPAVDQPRARMPDYLIVENVAALEVFPTDPLTLAGDVAVVHRNPAGALSVIKDYAENLIAEAGEAFQVTDPSSIYASEAARVRVDQAIVETEQIEAQRYLFRYGLSTLTEPLSTYEQRLLRTHSLSRDDRAAWPTWVKQTLELRRRRLANFLRHSERHRSIDVVPMSALQFYVEHGRYSEDCAEFGDYVVPVADRIEHLENVITMLTTNVRYELVVMEDDQPSAPLVGAGMLMMGQPDDPDQPWKIFYESNKPGPAGDHITVAFETTLDIFRHSVGGRVAGLEEAVERGATQATLRILHELLGDLRARSGVTD